MPQILSDFYDANGVTPKCVVGRAKPVRLPWMFLSLTEAQHRKLRPCNLFYCTRHMPAGKEQRAEYLRCETPSGSDQSAGDVG